jgi:hypothetical protein
MVVSVSSEVRIGLESRSLNWSKVGCGVGLSTAKTLSELSPAADPAKLLGETGTSLVRIGPRLSCPLRIELYKPI